MGILNVTPNSFSDGGRFLARDAALAHARAMVEEGAELIDIGGESTRPGAEPVPLQEELDRVMPVIEALRGGVDAVISIDTMKPEVMREAVKAGAGLINDVNGLRAPGALQAVAASGAAVCVMHMQGEPRTMQQAPAYGDVVAEVQAFLLAQAAACRAAGVAANRILLDPGFGFGKTLAHNLALLNALPRLAGGGFPLLIGLSRKSMLQTVTGRAVGDRLAGSLALATVAALRGAGIVRAHDVAATRDVLKVVQALKDNEA